MKYLFFISFLITLTGCLSLPKTEISFEEAEIQIYHEWMYAFKFQNFKTNGEVINRPPGLEQLLLRLIIPNQGGVKLKTHCVYYQVPYKKIMGHLKITELKNETECPEASSGSTWLELDKISNLLVKLENFKLNLEFSFNNKKQTWSFLLPNIEDGLIHEKYQAVKERKLYPGLSILRISEDSFDVVRSKYLGKINDRFSLGSAIRCQQIDKKCAPVGENRCDECAYGWYQVVDYSCPHISSKFCGQNHCGEKNEPACPRGLKIGDGSDSGICQSDLNAVFNGDHILVCQ